MKIGNFLIPAFWSVLGLALVIFSLVGGQNNLFLFGGIIILLSGLLSVVVAAGMLSRKLALIVGGVMGVISIILAYLDYKSIKDPIDFNKEKERRYAHVIQRLQDIREAQVAYKESTGYYTASWDSLIGFLKYDSVPVVKSIGTVPDSLIGKGGEKRAIELGIVSKDTLFEPASVIAFDDKYMQKRVHGLEIDSLPFIPFTNGAKFEMQADTLIKNRLEVPVFQVTDAKPFDPGKVLQVGSISEPKVSGNWE
jgi:membrane protein implicated in regulation of membrane protease activity